MDQNLVILLYFFDLWGVPDFFFIILQTNKNNNLNLVLYT